jgi:PAS domain S-box-containing protein
MMARSHRLVAWIAAAAVVLATAALLVMGLEVKRKVDLLATANSDSSQWSLAQAEVELLALQSALLMAAAEPERPLSEVRRRFDVFYSRIDTIVASPVFAPLRALPEAPSALAGIRAFLDDGVPLIDGDDAALRAALPDLAARVEEIRADMRSVSLDGVKVLSSRSDGERNAIAQLLVWVSALSVALFLALLLFVVLLLLANQGAKRRAQEQAQLRARVQAIVDTALDAVLVVSREGRVLEYNGAASGIFGYTREEALGASMEELIVPDHLRAAHAAGMARHRQTGERRVIGRGRVKLEAKRKSGEVFPVELSIAAAEASEGEVFVSFIRDISHRVAAERELIAARDEAVAGEKAKADLIAVMSHEIRTPLNGMLGMLDMIEADLLPERQKRHLGVIRASGKLLLHHVNDVLEISRADAGKLDILSEPFSLSELLTDLIDSQRGMAEHRGNTIDLSIGPEADGWVAGDPTRLRQVLLNLVGNAIKFTRNGAIAISAERDGADVHVRVSDTGIGVPEADRERIFEEFVTLDASYSRSTGGTGLGLAIARRLVRAMDGDIRAEAGAQQGSVFLLRLPLPVVERSSDGLEDVEAAQPGVAVPPLRVLVVEDNAINRIVVREMLELGGHRVDEAHDGQEGVAMALRHPYDLVFMDISMPVLDGLQATGMIRAAEGPGRDVPIVALTAHALPGEIDRFREAGLNDVLIKPISRASLESVVARVALCAATEDRPVHSGDAGLVDAAHVDEMRELLGEDRTARQIEAFLEQAKGLVAEMSEAVSNGADADALRAQVHRVAGSSGVLGAVALHAHLQALETRLVAKQATGRADVAALDAVVSDTARAMERFRDCLEPAEGD